MCFDLSDSHSSSFHRAETRTETSAVCIFLWFNAGFLSEIPDMCFHMIRSALDSISFSLEMISIGLCKSCVRACVSRC